MKTHFTNYIKHSKGMISLIAILIGSVFLSGCAKESKSNILVCNLDDYSSYPKILGQMLPSFKVEQSDNLPYYILNDGSTTEAFDTQAVGALEAGIAKYWYPQYLATVIIAVDRDQTNEQVTSWSDLNETLEEVAFFDTPGNTQMLTAAMSYGLEGEGYSLEESIKLLASIRDKGLLKMNSFEAPIIICFDYQAATLIENGRNIEIIIPIEGTFTYEKGLLSNKPLKLQENEGKLLLQANLRLLDGRSNLSVYPDEPAYKPAVKVADYRHFARITQNISRSIQRDVQENKIFMSADNREHIHFALVYIIIVTIWTALVLRRSMQKSISYAAFFTGVILNGWTLVRLIKYQIDGIPVLTRYLWYAFYIFQLSLPLVILWMAWAIDKAEDETFPPKWWRALVVLIGVLIIFVFTNDLHGLVFKLDLSRPDWGINYEYGFGYYIILFVCMMNLVAVLGILVQKGIKNSRNKGFILPIAIFIIFGIYNYKYIMRDPFFYETDLTIITGIFTMLMFEACIYARLIPVNSKYIDLFTRSPLKMQIINKDGEMALASATSIPLSKDILDKVIDSSPIPILKDGSLLFASPIPGGYGVWSEDISKLYQLLSEIQESTLMLTEANALLAEEERLKRSINEKAAKKHLMEQLEAEITESIKRLTAMIERLPYSEDHPKETTRIALLLCYIKRRCNLFFREKETDTMGADKLIVYIDELSGIAKYSNVQIVTVNESKGRLDIRYAILFYDFSYAIADLAVQTGCPYIVQNIGSTGEFLTMGFLPSEDIGAFKPEPSLISAIADVKGKIVIKDIEDAIGISITFPKGGGVYD